MSAYEQRLEPPDRNWQYLLFAAEPYETMGFKVQRVQNHLDLFNVFGFIVNCSSKFMNKVKNIINCSGLGLFALSLAYRCLLIVQGIAQHNCTFLDGITSNL